MLKSCLAQVVTRTKFPVHHESKHETRPTNCNLHMLSTYQLGRIDEHMDRFFALFLEGPRLGEGSLCEAAFELAREALTVMNCFNGAPFVGRCACRRLVIIIMRRGCAVN